MPKALHRRSHKSAFFRRYLRTDLPIIYYAATSILLGFLIAWVLVVKVRIPGLIEGPSGYRVVGSPTVTADFINRVLDRYHSPAIGKGRTLYDDGVKYDIDPAYALAFFMQESTFGTQGVARVTHSLGNIRATPGHPQYAGYRLYRNWEEGFDDWYRLISNQYVEQWGLLTVDQIIPVYAPEADNNDENAYIQSVKNAVDTWRHGTLEV